MINYPTSLDDFADASSGQSLGAAGTIGVAGMLTAHNDAIEALEAKVGIGATVPAANTILRGTGAGTSVWGGLTSAQLAAIMSDETGSGLAVFNDSPTIVTPTIASFTNAQHNHSNAAGGGQIGAAGLSSGAVTPDKLATGVAYHAVATDQTTTSTSYADLSTVGPTVTVTIGANGMALALWGAGIYTTAAVKLMSVAVSGATTTAASDSYALRKDDATFTQTGQHSYLFTGLTPGSNTFTCKYKTASGTGNFFSRWLTILPL